MAKSIFSTLLFCLLILTISQCTQKSQLTTPRTGIISVDGGEIWYKIIGSGNKTPILLLHGGPGLPSYYLNPLQALGSDRPVIFFDQLGCGRSTRDIDTELMTIDHYIEQVETLRKALDLKSFYLYGHSWGTMLGLDYYLKYPDAVSAMIFASPALSTKMWTDDAEVLIASLPDTIQKTILLSVQNESFETAEYLKAVNVYYENFLARKHPWSADLDSTFQNMNADVYLHMWGPSEFISSGTLKSFDRLEELKSLKIPTLFICGEYDEARPETVKFYQSLVPNAKFKVIDDAAHITMHDNPIEDLKAISAFLQDIETGF